MSLDLTLYDKNDEEVNWINWLRNPFGLERWAEANTKMADKLPLSLYEVCNKWNYDKSAEIDRKLFKEIIDKYWEEVQKLERGYFFFDIASYRQFVEPYNNLIPKNKWGNYIDAKYEDGEIKIPMEYFEPKEFNLGRVSLENYKKWFKELVVFAEELQNEEYRFTCSN